MDDEPKLARKDTEAGIREPRHPDVRRRSFGMSPKSFASMIIGNVLPTPRSTSAWFHPILLIGAYFVTGKLGLLLAFLHVSASPVWPPTGTALAALLLFGIRFWPAIFVGAFLVNSRPLAPWGPPSASPRETRSKASWQRCL